MSLRIAWKADPVYCINTYYLEDGGHAVLIDPLVPVRSEIISRDTVIDMAILTHEHYDHICSVNEIRQTGEFPVLCGEKAQKGLEDPVINMSRYADTITQFIPFITGDIESVDYSCEADGVLSDNEMIEWQGHALLIKETPGHSAGSISVLVDDRYLFSGDLVFKDYQTATRLPGGSSKAFRTVTEPWLDSLPQDVMVYPGHTEPFLLGERYGKNDQQ